MSGKKRKKEKNNMEWYKAVEALSKQTIPTLTTPEKGTTEIPTVLSTAATFMFDMYTSYIKAGFSPDQALHLVIAIVSAPTAIGGASE